MRTFETERLILRDWTMDDLEEIHRIVYSDPEVSRFFCDGPIPLEKTRKGLIQKIWLNKHNIDQGWGYWAVVRKEDNRLIGIVILGRPDRTWYRIPSLDEPYISLDTEIGYALGKEYWGNGYATEVCRVVIEYAFKELRIKRIVTGIDPENTHSNNLQKRLGAKSWRGTYCWILENNML